jgi:transposase
MQVILNKNQKRQLVVELYQQGKTMREIAQQVHMSFKDIATVIRQMDGSDNNEANSEHCTGNTIKIDRGSKV